MIVRRDPPPKKQANFSKHLVFFVSPKGNLGRWCFRKIQWQRASVWLSLFADLAHPYGTGKPFKDLVQKNHAFYCHSYVVARAEAHVSVGQVFHWAVLLPSLPSFSEIVPPIGSATTLTIWSCFRGAGGCRAGWSSSLVFLQRKFSILCRVHFRGCFCFNRQGCRCVELLFRFGLLHSCENVATRWPLVAHLHIYSVVHRLYAILSTMP